MVRPEYERKTWDLRKLDQPIYNRFLIFSPEMNDSLAKQIPEAKIERLKPTNEYSDIFLVSGKNLNPMEIYKRLGFPSVQYKKK